MSSIAFFLSKAIIHLSTAIASFMFSAKVGLAAISTKISIFEGKAVIYHSLQTFSLGFEVVGILFKSLLNRELKSLIGSLDSALKFERSLIKVVIHLSSPNLVKKCSWKISQLVIDPDGNEKYHDPATSCKV